MFFFQSIKVTNKLNKCMHAKRVACDDVCEIILYLNFRKYLALNNVQFSTVYDIFCNQNM